MEVETESEIAVKNSRFGESTAMVTDESNRFLENEIGKWMTDRASHGYERERERFNFRN